MEVEGQSALIKGSSSGLGEAIALRLSLEGVNVVIDYSHSDGSAMVIVEHIHSEEEKAIVVIIK